MAAEFFPFREENNVGKVENAGKQHFLFFPHCFQRVSFPGLLECRIVGKELALNCKIPSFYSPGEVGFSNIVKKREDACNQHYFLFPHFILYPKQTYIFQLNASCHANASNLEESRILSFGIYQSYLFTKGQIFRLVQVESI